VQLYPALDIRLGGLARAAPSADPLAAAQAWGQVGARWLHVVDLDRAAGTGRNDALVRALAARPEIGVQLGGGLTDLTDVAEALAWGVRRVVLGAGAISGLVKLARAVGPARLAVALDVGDDDAAVAALGQVVAAGVRCVVYRDLDRDGTLRGASLTKAAALVGRHASVILAGGIASLDELRAARRAGIAGVIVGRALHEGRFTLAEALACCG
jgi:phosphoribosylformimino-5-aminoimidazole carboxamide ribonucleotide (ProFAR) isomerase